MSPTDPVVYASVTGLLLLTAMTAIAVPARRAATVNPVVALREE
jgi:ABC-type lipoprotein release transport system permease subunit